MTWKELRKNMDVALKDKVVPLLRKTGFKGSFPHFRRISDKKIDVLGFQFSQWGPQFYIEIAVCPTEGETLLDGRHFPPEKIKHYQCGKRIRVGAQPFDFERDDFIKVAEEAALCLEDAELWWAETSPTKNS